jgi:hypothetical protein
MRLQERPWYLRPSGLLSVLLGVTVSSCTRVVLEQVSATVADDAGPGPDARSDVALDSGTDVFVVEASADSRPQDSSSDTDKVGLDTGLEESGLPGPGDTGVPDATIADAGGIEAATLDSSLRDTGKDSTVVDASSACPGMTNEDPSGGQCATAETVVTCFTDAGPTTLYCLSDGGLTTCNDVSDLSCSGATSECNPGEFGTACACPPQGCAPPPTNCRPVGGYPTVFYYCCPCGM